MRAKSILAVIVAAALCMAAAATNPAAEDGKPTIGAKPPQGAVVLFDGADASAWVTRKDQKPSPWQVAEGALVARGGDIDTKQQFQDFKLHVEFRTPEPKAGQTGQDRGNSGVYLLGQHEIQVLESYGLEPLRDGCGSIYNQKAADANVALPPMEWQSYDITYRSPRFAADGKTRTEKARVTLVWNGKKVHDNVEIDGATRAGNAEEAPTGPIRLQDHGHPVQYRNIWLVPAK